MTKAIKAIASFLVSSFALSMLLLWFKTYILGGLFLHQTLFMGTLTLLIPLVIVTLTGLAVIAIWEGFEFFGLLPLLLLPALQGCDRANANVQTLITDDCGVSWTLIHPGQAVPSRVGMCAYKVTVPDYPMQGETKFKTSFKDRVLASVEVSYEYTITDAKVFIGEAKYIGKANSDTDDASNASSAYESAENTVIDKRIREAATGMLITEDIVDFSQAEFEDKLFTAANELLKNKGVTLSFISFVPTPEEQTRLAIDMMTAMRVYKTRDLEELGKAIAVAKASASRIEVSTGAR